MPDTCVIKYKASNISIAEFIKRKNLSRSMFYRWIKKREEVVTFVPAVINKLKTSNSPSTTLSKISLNFSNHLLLTFDSSLSPIWIADLIKELK